MIYKKSIVTEENHKFREDIGSRKEWKVLKIGKLSYK